MRRTYISVRWWSLLALIGLLASSSLVLAQNKVVVVPLGSSGYPCQSCPPEIVVTTSDSIQKAIDKLPATGGTVFLKAGVHNLSAGIHINHSNISMIGEHGAALKLQNTVNQPVILIGTDVATPSAPDQISNISIANLEIDGNKAGQTSETDPARPHIRNNGIDIRAVSDLWISDVDVHDARSGGIVASWKSRNIFISGVNAHDNYYDGIALYDSSQIIISNFISSGNDHGAGLSLDNDLNHVSFNGGIIQNNADVGIFARHSENLLFSNLNVSGNGSHGAFLSHDGADPATTGVKSILFTGCSFQGNKGYGIQLASPSTSSNKNAVTGTLFNNNTAGCILYTLGSLTEGGNVCF